MDLRNPIGEAGVMLSAFTRTYLAQNHAQPIHWLALSVGRRKAEPTPENAYALSC